MTDTLFDLPDSPSPRLEWMRKHGVETQRLKDVEMEPWIAWLGDHDEAMEKWMEHNYYADDEYDDIDTYCTGDTEDEVIVAIAKRNNIKLWNEE